MFVHRNLNMGTSIEIEKDDILYHVSRPVVYAKIRRLAKELAVLGKIDIASRITDLILSQNRVEHGFSQMQFLSFAFEQTGNWPCAFPESARSRHTLHELDISHSRPIEEGKFEDIINQTHPSGYDLARCLNIAVALCEQRGHADVQDIKQDARVVRVLEKITKCFHYCFEPLIQYRRIWPLLASGIIAQQLGVHDAKLCAMARDIVETIRIRMEKGRQKSSYKDMSTRELLQILVENAKKNEAMLYDHERQDLPESYLHEPATERDINNLEDRLQISALPDDYKQFLLETNGLESVYHNQGMTPLLLNAQNVRLRRYPRVEPLPLKLVTDPTGTAQLQREYGFHAWPTAPSQIEIGRLGDDQIVYTLIGPSDVKPTIEAYQKALASDKVSEAIKFETIRQIEDQYGSMQDFEKMEWIMLYTEYLVPIGPIGTFQTWLEEQARFSAQPYNSSSDEYCLAYECRVNEARSD